MKTPVTLAFKQQFVAEMHAMVERYSQHPTVSCMHYAVLGSLRLRRMGVRAVIQAGTAMFRYRAPEHDRADVTTHYSYVFNPSDPRSALRMAMGGIPEMHCWLAIPSTQELIDPTTKYLPQLLFSSMQEHWTCPPPPAFFWGRADELPEDWVYEPNVEAIKIAFCAIRQRWPELATELIAA